MTAVSLSIRRGADGFKLNDFTVGTSAPGTLDIEFRFNLLDANSHAVTRKDLHNALMAIERALLESSLLTNAPPL